jgi:meso-butanediol dehydrogenase / (S,S)-butanediol dehydrogenase / diacetyl reductase
MTSSLAGKVALITGAGGGGTGRNASIAFAKRGVGIAAVGRTPETLEETVRLAREQGVKAEPYLCDVKDGPRIVEVVQQIAQDFGRIDILLNNAGEAPLGRLLDVTDEAMTSAYESTGLASLRFMRACHPFLKASGDAVIFNFTSSATLRWDMSGYGAYGATKTMVRQLTRAAAAEWGVDGIRALTIAPHVLSPGLQEWIDSRPEEAAAFFKTIPLRRVGDPALDIAEALVALCGPELRYLTGATIPLDGGQANFD